MGSFCSFSTDSLDLDSLDSLDDLDRHDTASAIHWYQSIEGGYYNMDG